MVSLRVALRRHLWSNLYVSTIFKFTSLLLRILNYIHVKVNEGWLPIWQRTVLSVKSDELANSIGNDEPVVTYIQHRERFEPMTVVILSTVHDQ